LSFRSRLHDWWIRPRTEEEMTEIMVTTMILMLPFTVLGYRR